jgi:hypothetical protein
LDNINTYYMNTAYFYNKRNFKNAWLKLSKIIQWLDVVDSLYPQVSTLAISPSEKWWQNFLEREIACIQWESLTCTHDGPYFFLLGVSGRVIFCFFLCSQRVPKMFSSSSQNVFKCVPQDVPNNTWVLSHMVGPKFNSPL